MILDIQKDFAVFDRPQVSLACPDNSSTKEKSMEHCWNDNDRVLRKKTVPVLLCPSNLICTELGSKQVLLDERTATNRQSHGTAFIGAVSAPFLRLKEDRPSTYNVTLRRLRATIVAVEKQQVLHIRSVCL